MGYVPDSRRPVTLAEEDTVGISYQATASEDWEDSVHAVVRTWVRELARML
jgi:hypothetical protein